MLPDGFELAKTLLTSWTFLNMLRAEESRSPETGLATGEPPHHFSRFLASHVVSLHTHEAPQVPPTLILFYNLPDIKLKNSRAIYRLPYESEIPTASKQLQIHMVSY